VGVGLGVAVRLGVTVAIGVGVGSGDGVRLGVGSGFDVAVAVDTTISVGVGAIDPTVQPTTETKAVMSSNDTTSDDGGSINVHHLDTSDSFPMTLPKAHAPFPALSGSVIRGLGYPIAPSYLAVR